MSHLRALPVLMIMTFGLGCEAPPAEDGLAGKLGGLMNAGPPPPRLDRIAPDNVKTIFENRHATVMRLRLPSGTRVPTHDTAPRAVYALREGDLIFTYDHAPEIESYSAGEGDVWEAHPGRRQDLCVG